jgi:glycosyltransferase involved in cell wall biosynthesis
VRFLAGRPEGARALTMSHPWLSPSPALAAKVARARATAALRRLTKVPSTWLGPRASAWAPLLTALPALLRADAGRVLDAVGRVDVLPVLLELSSESVAAAPLERALVTLWLALAGHPGLASPLALPGPFSQGVVDPRTPRLLALGDVRGLAATAQGPVVIGRDGRLPVDVFVASPLPAVDGTVIVDERLNPPDAAVVARVQAALTLVRPALPGGRLERVTIGAGDAAYGEARVGPAVDAADLLSSAQAAFTRAAAAGEPMLGPGGALVEKGRRLAPGDVLARACGNAVALPWRADRAPAAAAIVDDLDDLAVLADPTPAGAELVAAVRALAGAGPAGALRALFVNVDADDFVYSFHFGQSVERRCVERGWRVDRIAIDPSTGRDLAAELGTPVPAPVADGTEMLVSAPDDPVLTAALRRLATRRHGAVVANVRPRLFYDLIEAGKLTAPTLVWDRHLHDGLSEERARRGDDADRTRRLPIRLWSLRGGSGEELERGNAALFDAGLDRVTVRPWPLDLEFFQSTATPQPGRLFAGGESGRDWPLLIEAIRDLPLDVHLVTGRAPAGLPPNVRVDARLPLWRFRDALAAAAVTAIPLVPGGASGVTVVPMAMALGVAVVATWSPWMAQYVTDGEEALLVPAGDVGAFRHALVRLLEEPDLRTRLVANARRRVAALCDLEAFTREMFATLD